MYEYRHGGNVRFEPGGDGFLDLSANVNPLGMPPGVREAIRNAVGDCEYYPDHRSTLLRKHIAEYERVSPEQIFCGNGSSDIIFRLPRCARPEKVLLLRPTFSDYERAAVSFGANVVFHHLDEENGFACDERLLNTVKKERPNLVFLCNPNNPTGVLTKRDVIGELLRLCRSTQTLVVVDECFMEFSEHAAQETSRQLLNEFDNLVVLKAFTKIFALPGIRLGYALCRNAKLIDGLYAHGPDWPVSHLAQAAGIAAMQNPTYYIEQTVAFVTHERTRIKCELERMNYAVFDGKANFLLLKNPHPFDWYSELDARRIRVRAFGRHDGLAHDFYRVAISRHEHNDRFLEAVRQITGKHIGDGE